MTIMKRNNVRRRARHKAISGLEQALLAISAVSASANAHESGDNCPCIRIFVVWCMHGAVRATAHAKHLHMAMLNKRAYQQAPDAAAYAAAALKDTRRMTHHAFQKQPSPIAAIQKRGRGAHSTGGKQAH